MATAPPTNAGIAAVLEELADCLEAKGESPYRFRSYRHAAQSVRRSRSPLGKIARELGAKGLRSLPGVGEKIAGVLEEFSKTGTVELLETLRKEVESGALEAVRARGKAPGLKPLLPVGEILSLDRVYRERAEAGTLKRIAPKKLNPRREAWLPILSTEKKGWKFTIMFSNTETAHKLGRTGDWVVVYFQKGKGEEQCTVVTESRGSLKGRRVIRGREAECTAYYEEETRRARRP
jgi:DNA polymerase (family 10)